MRAAIGCAALVAVVAFVVGLLLSPFLSDGSLQERVLSAAMFAAIAFVAAIFLATLDRLQYRYVRRKLLERDDVDETTFAAEFPDSDPILLADTRRAVAEYFDVPAGRIHPTDRIREDLELDSLNPGLYFALAKIVEARGLKTAGLQFRIKNLQDLNDLATEIQRLIDQARTQP